LPPRNIYIGLQPAVLLVRLRQWFDIEGRGEANDFLETQGFLFALRDTMRLSEGGLLFAGIPCSGCLVFFIQVDHNAMSASRNI
jgi:hypothetical protein